jgi:hypothetical protein
MLSGNPRLLIADDTGNSVWRVTAAPVNSGG